MKAAVFVPGTMGTELVNANGEVLWPPKAMETQFGYRRVDKLLGDDVVPRHIIRSVACFDFYGSLLDHLEQLGYRLEAGGDRLYPFPYDWRIDLQQAAQQLATKLDAVHQDGASEIYLVAHSMGGLVSRLVLESGDYDNRPWFGSIRLFVAIATPHQGAPLALARILGRDSTLGISEGDFRKLTNDPRYPSAYQLLPAPTEPCCWDMADLSVGAVDIYDPVQAHALGMHPELLRRARYVHDTLERRAGPQHVRYFYFAASGHETVTRVNVIKSGPSYLAEDMVVTRTEDAGDGTVPFWSALPTAGQKQVVINEHSHAFTGTAFLKVFYRLLGGNMGIPLEARLENGAAAEREPPQLSIASPIVRAIESFELLLVPPDAQGTIEGCFMLQRLAEDGTPVSDDAFIDLRYQGPPITKLRMEMPGIPQPGAYALRFVGKPADSLPIRFAVARLPGQ